MGKSLSLYLLKLIAIVALPSTALATSVVRMSLENLSEDADLIVYGQIVHLAVDPITHKREAVLEAIEVPKCTQDSCSVREFRIPLLNRLMPDGKTIEHYIGAPDFQLNEKVVVYLRKTKSKPDARYSLVGFHQGKLNVYKDSNGTKRVAGPHEIPPPALNIKDLVGFKGTRRQALQPNNLENIPSKKLQVQGNLLKLDDVLNLAKEVHILQGKNANK